MLMLGFKEFNVSIIDAESERVNTVIISGLLTNQTIDVDFQANQCDIPTPIYGTEIFQPFNVLLIKVTAS